METTAALAEYIGVTIGLSRLEKAKRRDKLLQLVQLEGGELVDEADGLAAVRVACPACAPDKPVAAFRALRAHLEPQASAVALSLLDVFYEATSTIEVSAPFGLRATESSFSWVDSSELDDDLLLWGVRAGVLKLEVSTEVLKGLSESTERDHTEHLPRIARAVHRGKRDRLERIRG